MKILLLILALPVAAFAQLDDPAWLATATKPAAGGGSITNVLGLSDIASGADTWGADASLSYRVQSTANGTLDKAYVYVNNTAAAVVKVYLYGPDTDSVMNAEDALIGSSPSITAGGSAGWWPVSGATMSGGTVVSGSYYFVVVSIATTSPTLAVRTENASQLLYKAGTGYYDSPPANLGSSSFGGATWGRISTYITLK